MIKLVEGKKYLSKDMISFVTITKIDMNEVYYIWDSSLKFSRSIDDFKYTFMPLTKLHKHLMEL